MTKRKIIKKPFRINGRDTGYSVNRYGKVFGLDGSELNRKPRVDDYTRFALSINGKTKRLRGHQIVWMAFNGKIPDGMVINHKDGNKSNNNLDNLELVTHGENIKHGMKKGKRKKMSVNQAKAIIILRKLGYTKPTISEFLNIPFANVRSVAENRTFKYLER